MKYLVKYSSNWADEIDIDGFMILDESEYKEFIKAINFIDYLEFGIGTNEDIYYESSEEILNDIRVRAITEEQANMLEEINLTGMGFAEYLYSAVMNCVHGGSN